MNGSWLQILVVGAIALGAFAIVFDVVAYRFQRRALRRHYSRFPMFAIRDELVRLVACGDMSEESSAWQQVYRSVNAILDMHQRLDVVDVMKSFAAYEGALQQDPSLRTAAQHIDREADAEAARVPRFKKVLDDMDDAFFALVLERSWPLAAFRLKLVPWRRLTREISQQGAKLLPGWQRWIDLEEAHAKAA